MSRKTETVGPNRGPNEQQEETQAPPPAPAERSPDFASDEAAEAWQAAGRPPLPDEGSGRDGTYTKADVKKAERSEDG